MLYNCSHPGVQWREFWMGPEPAMADRHKSAIPLVVIVATLCMIALIILAAVLFNLDRYRTEVISYLQEKTGKPIEIGRLALTLFPSLSIRVDDFGLKNPAGFPSGYFVKARRIDATLDTGALLHWKVVIKSLKLNDAALNLVSTLTRDGTLRIPLHRKPRRRYRQEARPRPSGE